MYSQSLVNLFVLPLFWKIVFSFSSVIFLERGRVRIKPFQGYDFTCYTNCMTLLNFFFFFRSFVADSLGTWSSIFWNNKTVFYRTKKLSEFQYHPMGLMEVRLRDKKQSKKLHLGNTFSKFLSLPRVLFLIFRIFDWL